MQMKKTLTFISISLGIPIGFSGIGQQNKVQASSWHKGIPQIFKHTKWHNGSSRITFGTKIFSFWGPEGGERFGIPETNVKYKQISHHKYLLSHEEPHSGIFSPIYSDAKYVNAKKMIWKWDKTSKAVVNYRYYHW